MNIVNVIIGDPVEHSLSPQMHTAGYKSLGIENQFNYEALRVPPDELEKFVLSIKTKNIHGVSVTIPHKVTVMKYLDNISPEAKKIGAVNTIVNLNKTLTGYNTDWIGVQEPLKKVANLKDKRVAIIGAGGAAAAMTYATVSAGAQVTIFNRTLEKARQLADRLGASAKELDDLSEVKKADVILNASAVGLNDGETSPVPSEFLHKNQIVFDAVYVPYETKLLKDAQKVGATVIHGTEMLLYQGVEQFNLFTGHDAPIEAMREALLETIED